jgi:N-methylhydantoinase A
MRDVGLGWALVPRFPGVTSALGCVVADMRHDRVQTVSRLLAQLDCPTLEAEMRAVADKTEALLGRAGVSFERIDRQFEFDMLYLGQTHTVAVPLDMTGPLTRKRIQEAFDSAYLAAYGRLLEAIPVRVLNYRVTVTGRRPHFDMSVFAPPSGGTLESCRRGARTIRVDGADLTAPVYERLDLPEGAVIPGPAILEQPDSTVFIDPGLAGRIDRHGNVIIAREGAHATD